MASKFIGTEQLKNENIFMLELMIDQLNLDPSSYRDIRAMVAQNCVEFSFLDFPSVLVCEEDFIPTKSTFMDGCSGCGPVRNGTSCLFPVSPQFLKDMTNGFTVKVHVFKRLREGSIPDRIYVAHADISLTDIFNDLIVHVMRKNETSITKTLKECYRLHDSYGTHVGELSLYIRLSFFGKMIVTKFQMDLAARSIDFQSKEGKNLYKYNRRDEYECPAACNKQPCCPHKPSPPSSGRKCASYCLNTITQGNAKGNYSGNNNMKNSTPYSSSQRGNASNSISANVRTSRKGK